MKFLKAFLIGLLLLVNAVYAQPGSTDPGPGVGCSNGTYVYTKWVGYKDPYNAGGNNKQAYFAVNQPTIYTINNNQNSVCGETDRNGPNGLVTVPGSSACIMTNNFAGNNITHAGGTLVYYKAGTIGCPLDNNVIWLLLASSVFVSVLWRKQIIQHS